MVDEGKGQDKCFLHDVVIGIVQQLLDDACPDHDIYGSVRPAVVQETHVTN